MEIVIATHNLHKVREIRAILKRFNHIDLLSLCSYPQYQLPAETGQSFKENAILKAEHAAQSLNKVVIADDSGLVVPALNGRPGVFSSRFAGEKASDVDNRRKLLEEMAELHDIQRSAYFECCLALAFPEGVKKIVSGICEGMIAQEERGRNGFGYDPLFIKCDYDKTFAELEEGIKNRISHRSKAFDKMMPYLESL